MLSARQHAQSAFLIRCSNGELVVSIHDDTGRLVGRQPSPTETASHVILVQPSHHDHLGFIVRSHFPTSSIRIGHDLDEKPVLSVIVERQSGPNQAALRLPTSDLYVCAVPAEISADADLCANRREAGRWETFELVEVPLERLPSETRTLMDAIDAGLSTRLSADTARTWLLETGSELLRCCAVAVLRALPPREWRRLAGWLLEDDLLLDGLAPALASDIWLRRIVELRHWNIHRAPLSHLSLDQSWDRCATEFGWERNVAFNEILFGLMREHVQPRRSICVLTTARNEGLYLLEWMAHHRALGIEHFFVYSNQNNDGSDLLLDRLASLGLITWVTNELGPGVNVQTRAYTHCLSHLPQPLDYRWTVLIDLDEFVTLNPRRYGRLGEFLALQELRGADAVSMHWSMLAPSGQARWSPAPMLERFTHREPWENRHVKTVFITNRHVGSHPHNPIPSYRLAHVYLNGTGRPHHTGSSDHEPHEGDPDFDHVWISHYFYKSLDEWIWKVSRGFHARLELDFDVGRLEPFFAWFEPGACEPDRRALHHLDALRTELDGLRRRPGLREAEETVRREFLERSAGLKREIGARLRRAGGLAAPVRAKAIALLRDGERAPAGRRDVEL